MEKPLHRKLGKIQQFLEDKRVEKEMDKFFNSLTCVHCAESSCAHYYIDDNRLPQCRRPELTIQNGYIKGYGFEPNCHLFKKREIH